MTADDRPHDVEARREIVARYLATRVAEQVSDPRHRRRVTAEALTRSTDPTAREIGRQLQDGTVTARELAASSAYAPFLLANLERAKRFDYGRAIRTAIEQDGSR
ncbi:hypothetical protein ACFQO7_24015 [Catellatospora aurea]|uniref:Uncharacterized protein n=1 Tax=Catellatospora aurea TaxID=1337874 RepID=A0ABW2H127_9ACTN